MKNLTAINEMKTGMWYRKELSGGKSSNDKPYSITLKKGSVNKLLVFFVGGGLSWNEETASNPFTMGTVIRQKDAYYISHVMPIQLQFMHTGILNGKDKHNPFADWHVLTIPYATADFHLGNNDYPYQDRKGHDEVLHHRGETNVQKALEVLKEMIPDTPEYLLIAGVSAGGFGCVAHAPAIHRLYPDCKNIIVCADGSYLDTPQWAEITKDVWRVRAELEPYLTGRDIMTDLFHYSSKHMPDDTIFLHTVSLWDTALVRVMSKMNGGEMVATAETLRAFNDSLLAAVKKLKNEMPNYYYYLTDDVKNKKDGTTPHMFLGASKLFYREMQDNMSVANWLVATMAGNPVDIGSGFLE